MKLSRLDEKARLPEKARWTCGCSRGRGSVPRRWPSGAVRIDVSGGPAWVSGYEKIAGGDGLQPCDNAVKYNVEGRPRWRSSSAAGGRRYFTVRTPASASRRAPCAGARATTAWTTATPAKPAGTGQLSIVSARRRTARGGPRQREPWARGTSIAGHHLPGRVDVNGQRPPILWTP